MFPLEFGMASNSPETSWLKPILNDAACLHFTIFISKAYLDFLHGQNENSKTALAHFVNSLTILQQRLAGSNDELSTSDSTILVVVGLTMAATALGDLQTALQHLIGLRKIVTLRGGILALKGNRLLQTKICRQVGLFTPAYLSIILISQAVLILEWPLPWDVKHNSSPTISHGTLISPPEKGYLSQRFKVQIKIRILKHMPQTSYV